MLSIQNPFNKRLLYNALINPVGENQYFETSIIPKEANLKSFELWPEALTSIILKDFRLE